MSPPNATLRSRKERVVWNKAELQAVIDAAVIASFDDTDYIWAFLARGQKVLPAHRQRLIAGKHVVTPEILQAFQEARRTVIERGVPVEVSVEVPTPVECNRAQLIESLTDVELLELALKRFMPLIEGLRVLGGQRGGTESIRHVSETKPPIVTPTTSPAPKLTQPKVLLFGFAPEQESELRRRATNFNLELLFAAQQKGQKVPKLPTCNWCVVMTPDLTERAKAALKAKADEKHLFYVGGVDKALQKLGDINSRNRPIP